MGRSDWDPDWDRIQEIYQTALQMPPRDRAKFVASACQHDPALVSEVNSLLAAQNGSVASLGKLVGTTIDERYFVESELGQGAMGKVYRGLDRRLDNRPVVVKVLLEASLQDSDIVQRFKQEAVALAHINHSGVVGVLDAGELAHGFPYIVMEYVAGEALRSQIPCEGMDLKRAAKILKDIGEALDHVHKKEVFHRDLKPENIMVEPGTESVKIVDFGIAKVKDSTLGPTTVNEHGLELWRTCLRSDFAENKVPPRAIFIHWP